MMIGRHLYGVRWLYTVGKQFFKNLDMHIIIGKQDIALKVGGPRPCIVLKPVQGDIYAFRTEEKKFLKGDIPLLFICIVEEQGVVQHHSWTGRSEEHTSELQSRGHLVCRLLLVNKN